MKKYKLTNKSKEVTIGDWYCGHTVTVYQIKATGKVGYLEKGELGGWVENESNLSQTGSCWIDEDSVVTGNSVILQSATIKKSKIHGNATVTGYSKIFDSTISDDVLIKDTPTINNCKIEKNVIISGDPYISNSFITNSVKIYEDASISNANISGNAEIFGNATITGEENNRIRISDNVEIFGNAHIYGGNIQICDNSEVFENATVKSNTKLFKDASISQNITIQNCHCFADLSDNLEESIRCQTGLGVFDNKIIAYKQVKNDLSSLYDNNFVYKIGKIAKAKRVDESNEVCSDGLHFSNMNYWNEDCGYPVSNTTWLQAEIDLKDIITVQNGKIRCKKAKILGSYSTESETDGRKLFDLVSYLEKLDEEIKDDIEKFDITSPKNNVTQISKDVILHNNISLILGYYNKNKKLPFELYDVDLSDFRRNFIYTIEHTKYENSYEIFKELENYKNRIEYNNNQVEESCWTC